MAETFLATYKPESKPSAKRTQRWVLEARLLPYFGHMTIGELDQSTVDGFVATELRGRSAKTVNNRLAILSTLIKYVTGDKPRLRFKIAGMAGELASVPWPDVEMILAVADVRDRAVVLLAAEAGLRAGEIRGLMWTDVKDGQITVRRALDNETNEGRGLRGSWAAPAFRCHGVPGSLRREMPARDHLHELVCKALMSDGWTITHDPLRLRWGKRDVYADLGAERFNDEVLDVDHADYANTCCIDIPGPETDEVGKLAREWNVFIMAQAKARHKDWKDRFFNVGFIVDPDGNIVLQHYKLGALLPVERSISPHDIYDWWIEKYGRTLDAFWPVADTKIGRLGIMMAMEGSYPENGRGLAMNGAEVVYRASLPAPFTENDFFEITNRARALENNMYIVAPNIGSYRLYPDSALGIDAGGGQSMIVDYRGQLTGKQRDTNGSTFVSGVINIEALRHHRESAQVTNWLKDIRTELAQIIYEKPIYPKNRYLEQVPPKHADYKRDVIDKQVALMQERGIWKASSSAAEREAAKKK